MFLTALFTFMSCPLIFAIKYFASNGVGEFLEGGRITPAILKILAS